MFPKKPAQPRNKVEAWAFQAHAWLIAFRKRSPWRYRVLLGFILGALLLIVMYWGFYLSVLGGAWGRMPDRDSLSRITRAQASEVYSADSVLLGRYFLQNRTEINFSQLDSSLIQALVATEDARFFSHNGVDRRSQLRVLFKSILLGDRSAGGGSTLTQQLVKNLYPRRDYGMVSMLVNKQQESIIARRLEEVYSKEEILSHYLNTVSFGEQAYGVATAARRFFNKTPATLSLEESATLVGMLKATSYYNPRRHPERARERRNVVIDQMVLYSGLAPEKADSLKALPLELDYRRESFSEGTGTYFRAYLQETLKEKLEGLKDENYRPYNLFSDGLKIYTTLDSRMQAHAEDAVREHLRDLQDRFFRHWGKSSPWQRDYSIIERAVRRSGRYRKLKNAKVPDSTIQAIFAKPVPMRIFTLSGEQDTVLSPLDSVIHYAWFLNAGFLAMDPANGSIKAWVGGLDHRYFKFDHVTARRQVGSTFKPVVYATALEMGRDPCEYIPNALTTYDDYEGWTPENADGEYGGEYSMQGGLTNSVNTVSVSLIMETGPRPVAELARKLGVQNPVPREPAIALGAADLSVMDMTTLYAGIANGGRPVEPFFLTRIEDANGKTLFEASPKPPGDSVLKRRTVEMIHAMLRGVVDSGTAQRLRSRYGLRSDIAGKTGTSQNQSDGWFMGYTPDIVAGVWVGGEEPQVRFRSLKLGQGAAMALPVWAGFIKRVYQDPAFTDWQKSRFRVIPEDIRLEMDCLPYRDSLIGTGFWDWFWQEIARERILRRDDSIREARRQERERQRQLRQLQRQQRREERRRNRREQQEESQRYLDSMRREIIPRDTL